jgi:hypothetical protein
MKTQNKTNLLDRRQERPFLNDQALQGQLGVGPLKEFALHAVRGGQTEDEDGPVLAQAVAPIHGLSVFYFMGNSGVGGHGG